MVDELTTQQLSEREVRDGGKRLPALTILAHPDVRRVGERVRLVELERASARVSRLEPRFAPPRGEAVARALDDPFSSRSPLVIQHDRTGVKLDAPAALGVLVGGELLDGTRVVAAAALDDGVTIELGPRVALLLHRLAPASARPPELGLVGESDALDGLRSLIVRAAGLRAPVLLRGETGAGKELVARALHELSGRRGVHVSVNVAAIPPSTASSALFGHVRGAFTGAVTDLRGHFREADDGTLFLDEIGEIPLDVQAALLRVIETGEVQPVGGQPVSVDVRVIAATDRDLDAAAAAGTFRAALLHRLTGVQIVVPPLRARRDDIARLLVRFVREELAALGREAVLDDGARRRPWLPAAVVAALVRHAWPGNVRQLRNAARQLVLTGHDAEEVALDDELRRLLGLAAEAPARASGAPSADELRAVLERHKFRIGAAAAELGVSRARMYALAERVGGVRTARDVGRDEIAAALASHGEDLESAAAQLRISPRALTLRMTELGIDRP